MHLHGAGLLTQLDTDRAITKGADELEPNVF